MQLIQNDLFPSPSPPAEIVPLVGLGIDDLARTVDPFGLTTRRGIGEGACRRRRNDSGCRAGRLRSSAPTSLRLRRPSELSSALSLQGAATRLRREAPTIGSEPRRGSTSAPKGSSCRRRIVFPRLRPGIGVGAIKPTLFVSVPRRGGDLGVTLRFRPQFRARRAVDEQGKGMRLQLVNLARRIELYVSDRAQSAERCRPAAAMTLAPPDRECGNRARRNRRSSSPESSRQCRAGRPG